MASKQIHLLVDGSSHVVDHRETADGLQEVVVWTTGSIDTCFSITVIMSEEAGLRHDRKPTSAQGLFYDVWER